MAALVALLATTEDETLQRDMLRGLEQAMVGRAQVTMPAGWESVETKLNQSQQPEIRRRVRSLSLAYPPGRVQHAHVRWQRVTAERLSWSLLLLC